MLKTSIEICQTAIAAKKTTIAGTQSATRRPTVTLLRGCATALMSAPRRGRSRARLHRRRAAARAPRSRARRSAGPRACRSCAAAAGRCRPRRRSRPGRGLMTTTRVDRNTASEIECVTNTIVDCMRRQISSSSMFRRSRVISSRAPNGSSIKSSAGSNDERARDRDAHLHAAGELPRMVVAEALELDQAQHLLDALLPLRPVVAEHLERQRDVLRDRAPVEEHGVLEDHPVVVVETRPGARSCRSPRPCRPTAASGRRSPAAASTSRSPTARSARRTRPARSTGRSPAAPSRCPSRTSSSAPSARRRSCDVLRRAVHDELLRDHDHDEERRSRGRPRPGSSPRGSRA